MKNRYKREKVDYHKSNLGELIKIRDNAKKEKSLRKTQFY